MDLGAGFIIFLILVSPFVLWIIMFFIGTFLGFIKLLRSRHKRRNDGSPHD